MSQLLRFFLSPEDQNKIDSGTILIQSGQSGFSDALRLGFNVDVAVPSQRRLSLIPLTGGTMYFLSDPLAGGVKPSFPNDLDNVLQWIDNEYEQWATTGMVVVDVEGAKIRNYIKALGYDSLLNENHNFFNRQWYWPLKIPVDFLKKTILNLNRAEVLNKNGVKIPTTHPQWHAFAVETFLRGGYGLRFKTDDTDASKDDAVNQSFPEFIIDTTESYTEIWVALAIAKQSVHDGNIKLLKDLADSMEELASLRTQTSSDSKLLTLSPYHPVNGTLSSCRTLKNLRNHMVNAEPGRPLADSFFSFSPSYHNLRFNMPGNTDEVYYLGLLPTQKIKILDIHSNILQERRLPIHGFVAVRKNSNTDVIRLELINDAMKITGIDGKTVPETQTLDVMVDPNVDTAKITLQPVWKGFSDAERLENINRISDICLALSTNKTTRKATTKLLVKWEKSIRPSSWSSSQIVFRGSRSPWDRVSKDDLTGLFKGLQDLSFSGSTSFPVKPAHAMTLWIMEGKIAAEIANIFKHEISLEKTFGHLFSYSNTEIKNAKEEDIISLVRVMLLWNFWGLDIMNHHEGLDDNTPPLSGNLAASIVSQNNHFDFKALEAIKTEGIVPPTRDQVNQTISVRKKGSKWFFRVEPNHKEIFIWLQYAEYLRRQSRLAKAAADMGISEEFAASPAFGYMAYNGGMEQDLVPHGWDASAKTWRMFTTPDPPVRDAAFPHPDDKKKTWERRWIWKWWDRVKTELNNNPDKWQDKTIEDVLLNWKMTNFADELALTSSNENVRTRAVRVNGLHFAAITRTYGGVFPSIF
jgi:hypothetical protein